MARVKHIVGWISVVLLVVTLASIWILTEQNVEQTSSLSESTARAVEGRAADVRPDSNEQFTISHFISPPPYFLIICLPSWL